MYWDEQQPCWFYSCKATFLGRPLRRLTFSVSSVIFFGRPLMPSIFPVSDICLGWSLVGLVGLHSVSFFFLGRPPLLVVVDRNPKLRRSGKIYSIPSSRKISSSLSPCINSHRSSSHHFHRPYSLKCRARRCALSQTSLTNSRSPVKANRAAP